MRCDACGWRIMHAPDCPADAARASAAMARRMVESPTDREAMSRALDKPGPMDVIGAYVRGYAQCDRERRRERRRWATGVLVAATVGYQLGWWLA